MSSVPPPTKPPRGIKSPKEKSGLLMTVIRTLSTSESNEQRDKEKAKLEREYKKSDQQLDELISLHDNDLTQVMQTFSKVSALVNNSREKIRLVKENLLACKTLLSCRRDELKKLWLEGIEHKHTLQLLEEINQLQEVPSRLATYLAHKHYLHATQLLVSLDNVSLKGADGLADLRAELHSKTQALHTKLLEELSHQLYVQSTEEVVTAGRLQRQGSGRGGGGGGERRDSTPAMRREHSAASLANCSSAATTPAAKRMLDFSSSAYDNNRTDVIDLIEDVDQPDPEKDSDHFMAIIIECLALLNKLPEAVEDVRSSMHSHLLALIERTTQACLSQAVPGVGGQPGGAAMTSSPLLELLQLLIEQFKLVAANHRTALALLIRSARARHVHITLYSLTDYWAQVQATLQQVLTAYLDVEETSATSGGESSATAGQQQSNSASYSEQNNDISAYFSRRKLQRTRKSLFKFENSTYSLTKNSYLSDGHNYKYGDNQREKNLVCPPSPQNITVIYIPLSQFVSDIEEATACGPDNPCQLNAFIYGYVKEVFVKRQYRAMAARMEAATKCADAWRAATSTEVTAARGLSKPLLQSTVCMEECVAETGRLMEWLPSNAGHLLQSLIAVLGQYRETCVAAYRGIVQPQPEAEAGDKRSVCSAAWLLDDDINRFLKSLPNWLDLKAQRQPSHGGGKSSSTLKRDDTVEEESPEEVRRRNVKEAEMLASNLGESGGLTQHEIIADAAQLKCLAQLHESTEWLAHRLTAFTADLLLQHRGPQDGAYPAVGAAVPRISVTNVDGIPELPEQLIKSLHQLTAAFDELANTCLLVLHLEVRVQCFYYLLPMGGGSGVGGGGGGVGTGALTSQEPDPMVLELSRVLCAIDEAMASSLQARKSKYVFEGLGHLIAKILTSSTQFVARIDEECIRRMCRNIFILQQTLTNITLARETALDHAKHYFQLFYLTPDEILNGVMEKGAEFSELEYMNAFQLIQRSRQSADPTSIQRHMQRLSDILGEVGVTV